MIDHAFISAKGDREVNEDSVAVTDTDAYFMAVLADGLGRHGHGDIASSIVTSTFKNHIIDDGNVDPHRIIADCRHAMADKQRQNSIYSYMRSTVVFCFILNKTLHCGFVGDSRLYFFRDNKYVYRTSDHSIPQMLVDAGKLKEKKIRNHPDRNRLLKVLGDDEDATFLELPPAITMRSGDAVLLCSDGFWENVLEKEMEIGLKKTANAQEWIDYMEYVARKRGIGHNMDNYSAIAIRI